MNNISIICARGNSDRIYRKCTRPFAGKSLLEWAIIQRQACRYIGDIYVVTDDDEIEKIGRRYGVYVLREPAAYSGSPGGAGQALAFAKYKIANERNIDLDYNHLITKPLIKPGDIDCLFERCWQGMSKRAQFACGIKNIIVEKEIATNVIRACLQDFNGRYFETGIGEVNDPAIQFQLVPYDYGATYYELESWQNIDIDTEEDMEIAEILFEKKILKGNPNVYQDYAKSNKTKLHDSWKYVSTIGVENDE